MGTAKWSLLIGRCKSLIDDFCKESSLLCDPQGIVPTSHCQLCMTHLVLESLHLFCRCECCSLKQILPPPPISYFWETSQFLVMHTSYLYCTQTWKSYWLKYQGHFELPSEAQFALSTATIGPKEKFSWATITVISHVLNYRGHNIQNGLLISDATHMHGNNKLVSSQHSHHHMS